MDKEKWIDKGKEEENIHPVAFPIHFSSPNSLVVLTLHGYQITFRIFLAHSSHLTELDVLNAV